MQQNDLIKHTGSCHCQAVRFEIMAPADIQAIQCNCSICSMTGFLHLIIKQSDFTLLTDRQALQQYEFNTKTAKHLFCKYCGVKSFYIPRSHPDSYSINVNCLDRSTLKTISIQTFDGQNWENSISTISK